MNRTKRLMTAVTTSLLLTSAFPTNEALAGTQGQTATQPDESWKTDPQVQRSANTIFDWLQGTTLEQAKTQDDVLKKFPALGSDLVSKALKRLVWQGKIKRAGDASKSNPYKYFEIGNHGGGGGG
jgi:hypothetical protein